MATKEEKLEMEGEVVEAFPNGRFKVNLDSGLGVVGCALTRGPIVYR